MSFSIYLHIYHKQSEEQKKNMHKTSLLRDVQQRCSSVSLSVNKIPSDMMDCFGCDFREMVAYCSGSDRFEIGDIGSKVKVTVT